MVCVLSHHAWSQFPIVDPPSPIRSEIAELAEGLATSSENNSAVSPGNVLGIVKMELGDFRKSLSGLEVKVERLGAAFDEKFSTVGSTTVVSYKEFRGVN